MLRQGLKITNKVDSQVSESSLVKLTGPIVIHVQELRLRSSSIVACDLIDRCLASTRLEVHVPLVRFQRSPRGRNYPVSIHLRYYAVFLCSGG